MIKASNNLTGKLNASIIHVYPELENIEITPAVEDQEFKSDMYGYDKVRVKGVQSYIDEDIKPEYIKDGVDILGVVGNVVELQGEERTVIPSIQEQVVLPSEDKNGITKLTVQPVDNTIDTNITPENIVDGIEILGVVGNYKGIDTSDATVSPSDVLEGKTVYINNQKIVGTLPNNGELEFEPSDEEQEVPEGYTTGGYIKSADITKLNEYDKCLMIANSIEDMSDYSDTTATPEDIVKGKTAYSNGERIVGTLEKSESANNVKTDYQEALKLPTSITSQNHFQLAKAIVEADLSKEDLSLVTNFQNAFNNCFALKKLILPNTIANITRTYNMFYNCCAIESVPYFDTSKATDMGGMFRYCEKLTTVPTYNTSLATNFQYMFDGCSSLSEESLNNILLMCANATSYKSTKTLKYIGLTSAQATTCTTLPNYQAFLNAGWTTGY